MQIVCEACGHTGPAASVEVVEGVVTVRCERCGHASALAGSPGATAPASAGGSAVEAAPAASGGQVVEASELPEVSLEIASEPARATAASPDLPPVKCPKCGHRQHDPESCARCGLTFAFVADGSRPWEDYPPAQAARLPEARRLWAVVEAQPDDVGAHSRFVAYCREHGLITFAAMSYRHRLADFPEDAVSQSWLQRVVHDATALAQAMQPQRDEFTEQIGRLKQALLVVVGILCVVAVALMFRMMMVRTSLFDG